MMRRTLNAMFRLSMRLLMPDLARQMEHEGLLTLDAAQALGAEPEFIRVEDNGADLTIYVFSGLDVLYAGLARFEFQGTLRHLDRNANFVFVRDIHRMGFHLQPNGSPGGLAFFEREINAVKARLGGTRHIAVGSSIGGSAAFYFGTRCQMDQVVLFGAAFEVDCFTTPSMVARTFCDMRKLFTEPRAYVEMIVVTLSAIWGKGQLVKRVGYDGLMNPLNEYRAAQLRPRVSLFYGKTAWPDARQAQLLRDVEPGATLLPLPTGRHNTPSFLKQRGELGARLAAAITQA